MQVVDVNGNMFGYDHLEIIGANGKPKTPPFSITIGTTAIVGGTVGRVLFEGAGNVVQESANLFWDNTNGRLGIGTSSPAVSIDARNGFNLYTSGAAAGSHYLEAFSTTSTDATLNFRRTAGANGLYRFTLTGAQLNSDNTTGECQLRAANSFFWSIYSNGLERIRIPLTGNILIGTTTDAGYKLDVNGTSRFSGLTDFNADIVLNSNRIFMQSNSGNVLLRMIQTNNLQIYNNNASALLYLNANGSVQIGQTNAINWATFSASGHTIFGSTNTNFFSSGNIGVNTATDAGYKLDVNGTFKVSGAVYDSTNSPGTSGQVLSSTVTGTAWVAAGGGGGSTFGTHIVVKPKSSVYYSTNPLTGSGGTTTATANFYYLAPFIPQNSISVNEFRVEVNTIAVGGLATILLFDDVNGLPKNKIMESTNLDCSTSGMKTYTASYTFNAGTTYWLGVSVNANIGFRSNNTSFALQHHASSSAVNPQYFKAATFGSVPSSITISPNSDASALQPVTIRFRAV